MSTEEEKRELEAQEAWEEITSKCQERISETDEGIIKVALLVPIKSGSVDRNFLRIRPVTVADFRTCSPGHVLDDYVPLLASPSGIHDKLRRQYDLYALQVACEMQLKKYLGDGDPS